MLAYSWGLADFHRLGWMASFLFVVCGSMRLARFNIQTHVVDKQYFVGLPIPAAAGTIATLVLATPERLVSRVWMGGLLGADDRPVLPDDLDDPLPVLQGPRPAAAAPGLDPAGDRALLRDRGFPPRLALAVLALVFVASGPVGKLVSLLPPVGARRLSPASS